MGRFAAGDEGVGQGMEQLEFKVESKCDKCGEFKPRAFSCFTERMWYCDECKQTIASAMTNPGDCKSCDGSGVDYGSDGRDRIWAEVCTMCNGSGRRKACHLLYDDAPFKFEIE